jgi:hypothetical protein
MKNSCWCRKNGHSGQDVADASDEARVVPVFNTCKSMSYGGLAGVQGFAGGVWGLKIIISHHELDSIFISIMDIYSIYCP